MLTRLSPLVLALGLLASQSAQCHLQSSGTAINLSSQSYNADFGAFPAAKPITVANQLPRVCEVGQIIFVSPPLNTSFLWLCTSKNVWTAMATTPPAKPNAPTSP